MNEATLEANLNSVLRSIFPTFKKVKIKHQEVLTLQLGHRDISFNSKLTEKISSNAIYDILVQINDQNTILFELKKFGKKLGSHDQKQALSYALLIDPKPPITIVSNGVDTYIYSTYTGKQLDGKTIGLPDIEEVVNQANKLAADCEQEAIQTLLGTDYIFLSEVINTRTEEVFQDLIGTIGDYQKPICNDFSFHRELVEKVAEEFTLHKSKLVGVIGSPFSGKTNFLYQFYEINKSNNSLTLYVDCNETTYSVFQAIANGITQVTKTSVSLSDVRNWIFNSMSKGTDTKLYLLLDNYTYKTAKKIQENIAELLDSFTGENLHILYTVDEYNMKKLFKVKNRETQTKFGRDSITYGLKPLNNKEYEEALTSIYNNYQVTFEHGSKHNIEYREPRILRQLVSFISMLNPGKDKIAVVPAVTDLGFLQLAMENQLYPDELHSFMKKMAACYFADAKRKKADHKFKLFTYGTGAIDKLTFQKHFKENYKKLIKSAFVKVKVIRNYKTFLFPQFPELLSWYLIEQVLKELSLYTPYNSAKDLADQFLKLLQFQPYPEIIGCGVMVEMEKRGLHNEFGNLIKELLKRKPYTSTLSKGSVFRIYLGQGRFVDITVDEEIAKESSLISNELSYMILSHLVAYPFITGTIENPDFAPYIEVVETVGSSKHVLRRPSSNDFQNIQQLAQFEIKEHGSIVSGEEGIVEPIVQSIQHSFKRMPHVIKSIVNEAIEEKNINLVQRIYLATRSLKRIDSNEISTIAVEIDKMCEKFLTSFVREIMTKPSD